MMPEDAICVGMTQESVQALSEELNRLLPVIHFVFNGGEPWFQIAAG